MNFIGPEFVSSDVNRKTIDGGEHLRRLREAYTDAFGEWALQVRLLQAALGSAPGTLVVKEAEGRVAAAEIAYRHSRDRLAKDMVELGEPNAVD